MAPELIPFNRPTALGCEAYYVQQAIASERLAGAGPYSRRVQQHVEQKWGLAPSLLTTSCTDALELSAQLLDLQPGDEVIVPAYTFVSTANAFLRQGASLRFADSEAQRPHLDPLSAEAQITPRTRAIVAVHYGGAACNLAPLLELAQAYGLALVEDAAQALDSYWLDSTHTAHPLGRLGRMGAFSFHESKNLQCGEGGLLALNDPTDLPQAEVLWEKGTNRCAFFRGEAPQYEWLAPGSSYLMSDLLAAYLLGQLEQAEAVRTRRLAMWNRYQQELAPLAHRHKLQLPQLPPYAQHHNAHCYYVVLPGQEPREALRRQLLGQNIHAVFHYQALHQSPFGRKLPHSPYSLPQAERYTHGLLRLPLHYTLTDSQQSRVLETLFDYFRKAGR